MRYFFGFILILSVFGITSAQIPIDWQRTSWTPRGAVRALLVNDCHTAYLSLEQGGVFRSTDFGASWQQILPDSLVVFDLEALGCNTLFAASKPLFRSDDAGTTWEEVPSVFRCSQLSSNHLGEMIASQFAGPFFWFSSDSGTTWLGETIGGFDIQAMAMNNSGDMFAAGCNLLTCQFQQSIRRRLAGDSAWSHSRELGSVPNMLRVGENGVIYALTIHDTPSAGRQLLSTDNGETWQGIGHMQPGLTFRDLRIDSRNRALAVSNFGLYGYDPAVAKWAKIAEEQVLFNQARLAISASDGLYVATGSGAVYRSREPVTGISVNDIDKINQFELLNVYPNPFNSEVSIEVNFKNTRFIQAKVYDAIGSLVRNLANPKLNDDIYRFSWDATDDAGNPVSSGTYFIHFQTSQSTQTRKIILAR